jgi:hypothetical protein
MTTKRKAAPAKSDAAKLRTLQAKVRTVRKVFREFEKSRLGVIAKPKRAKLIHPEDLRGPLQRLYKGIARADVFAHVIAAAENGQGVIDPQDAVEHIAPLLARAVEDLYALLDAVEPPELGPLFLVDVEPEAATA